MNLKKKHNVNAIAAPRMNFIRKKRMCKERTSLKKSQRTHSKREHLLQTNKEYKYKILHYWRK